MFATRGEDFQTLFIRAPFQNLDVYVADAPAFHLKAARLVKVDGVSANQRIPIIVDNVLFVCLGNSKSCSQGKMRPVRRGAHHVRTGKATAERIVVATSALPMRIGSGAHIGYATCTCDSR